MTAEDAEGVGSEAASSKHGSPVPGTPTRFQVAEIRPGDDRGSGRGVAVAGYAQCLPKLHFGFRAVFCLVPPGPFSEALERTSIGGNAIPFPTSLDRHTLRLCRQM